MGIGNGDFAEAVTENNMTTATVDKTKLIVTRLDDTIIAFSRTLPSCRRRPRQRHYTEVVSVVPDHGWKFDISQRSHPLARRRILQPQTLSGQNHKRYNLD